MAPPVPKLLKLNMDDILEFAGSSEITASLMTLPGQLSCATHHLPCVAQAIMSRVSLHFTSRGHTTQLIDLHQQPNAQAVSIHIYITMIIDKRLNLWQYNSYVLFWQMLILMSVFSEDVEEFPTKATITAALQPSLTQDDENDEDDDDDEDNEDNGGDNEDSHDAKKMARKTACHEATMTCADWAFFYKPSSLQFLTSSLFDIFDECFQVHFLVNGALSPSFLSQDGKEGQDHEADFLAYAKDVLEMVEGHLETQMSPQHQDSTYARLYFYLYIMGELHRNIFFMCSSMVSAVNKELGKFQHGLSDVSSCLQYDVRSSKASWITIAFPQFDPWFIC